jgi:hypothetical protein
MGELGFDCICQGVHRGRQSLGHDARAHVTLICTMTIRVCLEGLHFLRATGHSLLHPAWTTPCVGGCVQLVSPVSPWLAISSFNTAALVPAQQSTSSVHPGVPAKTGQISVRNLHHSARQPQFDERAAPAVLLGIDLSTVMCSLWLVAVVSPFLRISPLRQGPMSAPAACAELLAVGLQADLLVMRQAAGPAVEDSGMAAAEVEGEGLHQVQGSGCTRVHEGVVVCGCVAAAEVRVELGFDRMCRGMHRAWMAEPWTEGARGRASTCAMT